MFNMNFAIAIAALAFIVYFYVTSNNEERTAMIAVGWCAFLLGAHLVIGIARVAMHDKISYGKKATALIEECESTIPRTQFCTIEMKAVAK